MPPTFVEIAALAVQARKRIRPAIYDTPLIPAKVIGKSAGSKVLFKAENFQLTGSFKIRGATSKLSQYDGARLITASSGNHGIGSACAAQKLSRDLTVVLPVNVSQMKLDKIRSYGVEVIFHGAETGSAEKHAQKLASTGEFSYVSPYNDPDIIAGQGTIGLEILEQCYHVDNVFISMGGGGLISGVGSVIRAFSPDVKIWGVSAVNSRALAASVEAGEVVETEHLETLAAAVAGGIDSDTITLPLATSVIDHHLDCSEDEILQALISLTFDENMIVEGSAALALAGYNSVAEQVKGQTSVVILCGSNVDQTLIDRILRRS